MALDATQPLPMTVSRLVDGRVGNGTENNMTTLVALHFSLFDFPWTFALLCAWPNIRAVCLLTYESAACAFVDRIPASALFANVIFIFVIVIIPYCLTIFVVIAVIV